MSSNTDAETLAGSSGDQRPNLGILLRVPFQKVVRRVSEGLVAAGFDDIGPAHTAVFQHIEATGSRLTDLAERAQITKQSMGYLVDQLERRGYLQRQADPTDRRAKLICLTPRGWEQIRSALTVIAAIEDEWTHALGNERMELLRETLAQLRDLNPEQATIETGLNDGRGPEHGTERDRRGGKPPRRVRDVGARRRY